MNEKNLEKVRFALLKELIQLRDSEKITIVGVDGPTAAGKTLFTNGFAEFVEQKLNTRSFIFRLDWTLISRAERVEDLSNLKRVGLPFELEAELHMNLEKLESFLQSVTLHNSECDVNQASENQFLTSINGLYDRENDGLLVGSEKILLNPGDVLFVEGHYSLRSELDKYFDINILMLSQHEALLERKINRVSGYRGAQAAEEYFNLIDIPSFDKHLERFGQNATHIIENTDFRNPSLVGHKAIKLWRRATREFLAVDSDYSSEELNTDGLINSLFQSSILKPSALRNCCEYAIQDIQVLHQDIIKNYFSASNRQNSSVENTLRDFVKQLNAKCSDDCCQMLLDLRLTENIFCRHCESSTLSFGIGVEGVDDFCVLFDFFENKIELSVLWPGGVASFVSELNNQNKGVSPHKYWRRQPGIQGLRLRGSPEEIFALTPLRSMKPDFLIKSAMSFLNFTDLKGKGHNLSEVLKILGEGEFLWVHRFKLQREARLMSNLCEFVGAGALSIGNYLISFKTSNVALRKKFRIFQNQWTSWSSLSGEELEELTRYDNELLIERAKSSVEVSKLMRPFNYRDGCLVLKNNFHDVEEITQSLKNALSSNNRSLRRMAFEFIERYFSDVSLDCNKMWPEIECGTKSILVKELIKFQPSALGELYLWQTISGRNSAILGANIYDITKKSVDALGHILAAQTLNTPVVLQASLNALGESFRGSAAGYLNSPNGARGLIDAVLLAVRLAYVKNDAKPPLFGIGLDHVDSRNDDPPGRARNFLKNAVSTNLITHVVLDGSSLFKADDGSAATLRAAYGKVSEYAVDLIEDVEGMLLVDKEICGGELNYIGADRTANIPDKVEIKIFIEVLKEKLKQKNMHAFTRRPLLFIGNVGTTHHAGDTSEVKSEITGEWVSAVKGDLFVSAVLHGTTGTDKSVLKKSLVGCKKVNVAGDFLHSFLNAVPRDLRQIIHDQDPQEPKKALSSIYDLLLDVDCKIRETITSSIKQRSVQIMKTINSPQLSESEIQFFREIPYSFDPLEINEIVSKVGFAMHSSGNVLRQV